MIGLCVHVPDPEALKRACELSGDILFSVVCHAGIHHTPLEDRAVEGILHDRGFLVVVPARFEDKTGMVVDQRGKIGLYLSPAFSDGEL